MAGISTSIQIQDRATQPLGVMIRSLQLTVNAMASLNAVMGGGVDTSTFNKATQAIEHAVNEVTQLENAVLEANATPLELAADQTHQALKQAGQEITNNTQEQERFNNAVQQGANQSNELVSKLKKLAATYLGFQTLKKTLDLSDELTQTTARLDMMNSAFNQINNSAMQTNDLVKLIHQSSQNARGSFSDMAAVVAKFGNNARDAFSSQQEVVDFANLIQKQMTLAGASTAEASNAMLQLSQALGSGTLRGDELNSIFEQAPNLIQSIAKHLDVPIGQIRQMAQEGQLSAQVVKEAIFASADDINAAFQKMPLTWNQMWTLMANTALMKFQPVLDKLSQLANSAQFQSIIMGILNALGVLAEALVFIMDIAGSVASFIIDNWSLISPVIQGIVTILGIFFTALMITNGLCAISAGIAFVKAAADMVLATATGIVTAAQHGFNAALAACPLMWIVLLVLILIAVIYVAASAVARMTGVTQSGFGLIAGYINVVIACFKNLGSVVATVMEAIWSAICAVATNMSTAFSNAISGVQSWFYDLLSTACSVIAKIAAALNKLPFVSFDYSGIVSAASDYAAKSAAASGSMKEFTSVTEAFKSSFNKMDAFQSGWASNAFNSGAAWGDGVADKVSNMFDYSGTDIASMFSGGGYTPGTPPGASSGGYDSSNMPKNMADTAGNTARTADALEVTNDTLKYLRDIAERDVINRFTTAEIKVEMNNTQHVNSEADLDGIVDYLASGVMSAMEKAAEGVHV